MKRYIHTITGASAKWTKGEALEKIRMKEQELPVIKFDGQRFREALDEELNFAQQIIDKMARKMADDADMVAICELAKLYILDEQIFREGIVHCCNCTIKKAVQHKDGIVWRCPHRTDDVKMEGYCESGVRADEC